MSRTCLNPGRLRDFDLGGALRLGRGGTGGLNSVPSPLQTEYRNGPISYTLLARVKL